MSASSDRNYNVIAIAGVYADVTIMISPVLRLLRREDQRIAEDGPTQDSYTVVANTPPEADVILMVTPDQQTDIGMAVGSLFH